MIKTQIFPMKNNNSNNNKKCQEGICKYNVAFFTVNLPPLTRDVNMLETLEIGRKYR